MPCRKPPFHSLALQLVPPPSPCSRSTADLEHRYTYEGFNTFRRITIGVHRRIMTKYAKVLFGAVRQRESSTAPRTVTTDPRRLGESYGGQRVVRGWRTLLREYCSGTLLRCADQTVSANMAARRCTAVAACLLGGIELSAGFTTG